MREEVETYVNQRWSELKFNSAVDLNYAIEYYQNEIVKCSLFIKNASNAANELYQLYMLGTDISEKLRDEHFYSKYFYKEPFFVRNTENIQFTGNDEGEVNLPVFLEFQLTEDLYNEVYAQVFEFICFKEMIRIFSDRLNILRNEKTESILFENTSIGGLNGFDELSNVPVKSTVVENRGIVGDLIGENKFNNIPLEKVIAFFKQLCDAEHLVLTELEFNHFIQRAFLGNASIEKQSFNTSKRKKGMIIKLFNLFYNGTFNNFNYEKQYIRKDKYVKLITDNFSNWDHKSVSDNFSRIGPHIWNESLLK